MLAPDKADRVCDSGLFFKTTKLCKGFSIVFFSISELFFLCSKAVRFVFISSKVALSHKSILVKTQKVDFPVGSISFMNFNDKSVLFELALVPSKATIVMQLSLLQYL